MITRLKIENFTAFDSLELEFGKGIHTFIGANGTGKTHIIKILYSFTYGIKMENGHFHENSSIKIKNVFFSSEKPNIVYKRDKNKNAMLSFEINGIRNSLTISSFIMSGGFYDSKAVLASFSSIFIPAKDILANAKGFQSLYRLRETSFEEVYDDILTRAYLPKLKIPNPNYKPLLEKIEKFIGGKVESRDEEFYLITDKKALELSLVAEGWRKFALLWLLLQNGSLEKGSVLFWDEPEANLNPSALPLLAHILLQLSREGVQVFLATHSYVLLKELDLQKKEHPVNYHSLYFEDGEVRASTAQDYDDIQHNLIERENLRLYYAELGHVLDEEALIKLESEQ